MNITGHRCQILDMARGLAIFLMVGFHFSYNLEYFHLVEINIKENPFWTTLRSFIVSLFIFIAGISLYLTSGKRTSFTAHLKKQKWLVLCALLVSLATFPLFPRSWIYFGVLHFILTARIIGFALTGFFGLNLIFGLIFICSGLFLENEIFNPKWINWLGFTTQKPFTEDYVPIFPWLGVFLLGMFAGRFLFHSPDSYNSLTKTYPGFPAMVLSLAGRNSLLIYMIHQPLLMGLIFVGAFMFR